VACPCSAIRFLLHEFDAAAGNRVDVFLRIQDLHDGSIMSTTTKRTGESAIEDLDVIIVGAGFAGLYLLDRLRRLGMTLQVFIAELSLRRDCGLGLSRRQDSHRITTSSPNTSKARRFGFHELIDTEEMFLRMFSNFRRDRIIPLRRRQSRATRPSLPRDQREGYRNALGRERFGGQ
jgi:hypothetical protein